MGAPGGDDSAWRLAAGWCPPCGDGAVMSLQAPGAWWCVMPARRSGARFRLAAWDARQADLVQGWCVRKVFYTALRDVHDTMLWLGPSYECILYWGNTWPLEVVAWWFRKSSGVPHWYQKLVKNGSLIQCPIVKAKPLTLGLIIPVLSISATCFSIFVFNKCG